MSGDRYANMRRPFVPSPVRLTIVAESPPKSGKYFYDLTGSTGETLYRELMRAFKIPPGPTKRDGLTEFQAKGLVLFDATYTPVNDDDLTERERDAIVLDGYQQLVAKLDRKVPVVLIKHNVCKLLEPLLVADEFAVLNRGVLIPFPGSGQQGKFQRLFAAVVPPLD
jgi:hypothetical protein